MSTKKAILTIVLGLFALLIVACTPRMVTITFNSNGGTKIEAIEIEQGKILQEPSVVKEGYTFDGWFENANFTADSIFDFSIPVTRNLTLYAKWSINSYQVNYFPNNDTTIPSLTKTFGAELVLPTVTKEGFTFGGWYTNDAFTGTPFDATTMPATNLNLYAKWNQITFTITFLINEEVYQTKTVNYGDDLTDIPTPPAVTGKVRYWDQTDFTNITANMDVHLLEDDAYYTVTIIDEWDHVYETLNVKHGDKFVPTVTPSKAGYNFMGYNPGLDHIVVSDLEVLVVYEQVTFSVIFRDPDGIILNQSTVNYGEAAVAPNYTAPAGYEFTGWDKAFDSVTSSLIINAQIAPLAYEIILHANDGVFSNTEATLTIEKAYLETVGIPEQPTRAGYNFVGWFSNPEGTGNAYQFSAGTTMPIDGLTLYAKWSLKSYTITYENLAGIIHGNATSYNISTAPITLTNPASRTGYQFVGWFTALTDGTAVTSIDTSILSNQTVYARWSPISYGITYNNLQGTTHSNPATYTIESATITLLDPSARTGYTFIGWFTQLSGGTEVESIVLGSTGAVAVYARWSTISYDITYNNLQGASNSNPATYNIETATINLVNPGARVGYTFVGWFDALVDGNEVTSIAQGSTGNKVLYARWNVVTYNLTYNNLQGTTHCNPSTYNIETATINLADPSARTGYTFVGWFDELVGGTEVESITLGSTGDMVLYARWSAKQYTLSYNSMGGSAVADLLVTYDASFTLGTTTRLGYNFSGWTKDSLPFSSGTWTIDSHVTLVATWSPITYNVTYLGLDGETHSNPATYNIETTTIILSAPSERTGYEFTGWFTQSVGGTEVTEIALGSTGNKTYYAQFSPVDYSITYNNLNGASNSNQVTYNIETETFNLVNPGTRLGYTFAGWFDAAVGGNQVTKVEVGTTEDIVLYARWNVVTYNLTYNNLQGASNSNPTTYNIESATINLADPGTRTGYTFAGWFNAEVGGDEVTEIVVGSTGNKILYARWNVVTYDLTYENLQGTTHGNPATYNIETATINLADPSARLGYTFVGWFDELAGGTEVESIVLGSTEDMTLYARWSPISYGITYNNLQGTTHSNPANYTIESATITLTDPTARTGYNFVGWFTQLSGGTEVESIVLGTTGAIAVYARWEAKQYTVTYDVDGGSALSDLTVTYNATFTLGTSTKVGYTFAGWTKDGQPFTSGTWTLDQDVNLVAVWTVNEYTITYTNLFGETHSNVDTYTIETTTITLTDPTDRDYYTFFGWYDAATGGNLVTEIMLGTSGNITLYARWNPIEYGITYENLYDMIHENPEVYTIESDFDLEDPSIRTGHRFVGWYDDAESGMRVLEIVPGQHGPMTLYARWEIAYYDVEGEYFYESVALSTDQQSILSPLDPDNINLDGQQSFVIPNLLHGTSISPITEQEGYVFNRFVYNSVVYEELDDLLLVTDDMQGVEVYYRRIILEVSFTQIDPVTPTQYMTDIRYVYYNGTIIEANIPVVENEDVNITAIWERSVFTNVRESMGISALYFNNTTKTIRFKDGSSIIFIASQGTQAAGTVFIGSTSPIWSLSRPGYKFLGWFYKDGSDVEQSLPAADYAFDSVLFVNNQTEIYSKWELLPVYSSPYDISVTVNQSGDITITWKQDLGLLAVPEFNFYIDQILVDIYSSTISQNGNIFTLAIPNAHADHVLFDALVEVGMHSVAIQAIGDDINTVSGPVSSEFIFERKSIYDQTPEAVAVYDYFIIEEYDETQRYIFYTNMTYQFNSTYKFEILTGTGLVNLENLYTMKMNNISGSFTFKLTRPNLTFDIYDALVVKDIKQFTYGTNYQTYITETSGSSTYLDTDAPYYVGSANNFYLDVRMTNTQGNRIKIDDALLTYSFKVKNGSNFVEIEPEDLANHLEMLPNNRIKFKSAAIGGTYQIDITPRYKSLAMTAATLTYVVTVNAGHNAFTNQELKELFADSSVNIINLHANITAALAPSQLNADGSPKNVKNGAGNVYNRIYSSDTDSITIEGNFMTINGSSLPYSNARSGSGLVGFAEAFEIINVQIAMFNYNVSGGGTNLSHFTMNNLTIIGNTTVPAVNLGGTAEEILLQERLMSRNSGGYIGVMVSNGSSTFNNVQVKFAVIGFSHYAYGTGVEMTLNQVIVDDSWANGLYMQGATLTTINDSFFGQSGGPAFHVSDSRPGDGINNPTINIDNYTEIDNFISGDEAWFKAYGMTGVALQLKSNIQSGIASTGRGIIKMVTHPVTGLQTEMINFILLTEPHSGAKVEGIPGTITDASEVQIIINGTTLNRSFDYLTSGDPRISGGQYAFPIGLYSDLTAFGNLLNTIGTYAYSQYTKVLTEAEIGDLGKLASFYNLTGQQIVDDFEDAGWNMANIGNHLGITIFTESVIVPQYFEVLSPLPIFSAGYAIVIIELRPLS